MDGRPSQKYRVRRNSPLVGFYNSRSVLTRGDIGFYSLGSDPLETGRDHTQFSTRMCALKNRAILLHASTTVETERLPNRFS